MRTEQETIALAIKYAEFTGIINNPVNQQNLKSAFKSGYKKALEDKWTDLDELYAKWCKETKRGGAILIGGSIREFFNWLNQSLPKP